MGPATTTDEVHAGIIRCDGAATSVRAGGAADVDADSASARWSRSEERGERFGS